MAYFAMKTLSVIIPLYNSAKWLEKCLYSVLAQDIPESEMEVICVNDDSPDNSADLAREIGRKHPSIIVIDQPNQGPSGARNTGMKAATGKYLCFVDPDDYVEPNVYGKLVQQMEEEQLDMLRFNYQIVDENYQHVEKRPFENAFDYTPKLMSGAEFLATRLDIAVPPPRSPMELTVWCGARKGRRVTNIPPPFAAPATEWMRDTSSASSTVSGGRMLGTLLAIMVFPALKAQSFFATATIRMKVISLNILR